MRSVRAGGRGGRLIAATAVGLVLSLLAVVGAAPASSAAPPTAVHAVHAVPAAKRGPVLTFYFGLRRPEAKAVAAFWAVQRPGSSSYRRFGTPAQVSQRYGASRATRRRFVSAMRKSVASASSRPPPMQ